MRQCLLCPIERRWFWTVWLLTRCCLPVLNWRVIYCTVARVSVVIMRASCRWSHSFMHYCSRQLTLAGMALPKSTYSRYTFDTVTRKNHSSCNSSEMKSHIRLALPIFPCSILLRCPVLPRTASHHYLYREQHYSYCRISAYSYLFAYMVDNSAIFA